MSSRYPPPSPGGSSAAKGKPAAPRRGASGSKAAAADEAEPGYQRLATSDSHIVPIPLRDTRGDDSSTMTASHDGTGVWGGAWRCRPPLLPPLLTAPPSPPRAQ